MQRLTYIPPNTETGVTFEASRPYILEHIDGVGGAETSLISDTIPGVPGNYVYGLHVESREVKARITVCGKTRREMYEARLDVIRALSPYQKPGTLIYENDAIRVRIPAYPANAAEFSTRLKNYNSGEIVFRCPAPYWEAVEPAPTAQIGFVGGGFKFPFEFNEDNNYSIKFAETAGQVVIYNPGTAETPVKLTITAPADSPAVTNETTGETIRVNTELYTGDILEVYTKPGEKYVHLTSGGVTTDAFNLIDLDSVFFQLVPGENVLTYNSGNDSNLTKVSIQFRPRYAGV